MSDGREDIGKAWLAPEWSGSVKEVLGDALGGIVAISVFDYTDKEQGWRDKVRKSGLRFGSLGGLGVSKSYVSTI